MSKDERMARSESARKRRHKIQKIVVGKIERFFAKMRRIKKKK